MPRKERIEYAGARYHIISRGSYRKDLFSDRKTGEAFEAALFEVVARCGWRLYAYVIMVNHYHLAVETPQSNLVAGMKWIQSTFATRFNRFRGERGHVFQGRYKSILLDEDRSLRRLTASGGMNFILTIAVAGTWVLPRPARLLPNNWPLIIPM